MIRQATLADIPIILTIIEDAKVFLRNSGVNQWQDGYPNQQVIEQDIALGQLFVFTDCAEILAMAVLQTTEDMSYRDIYDGNWQSDAPYVAVHRFATHQTIRGTGIGSQFLKAIEAYVLERYQRRVIRLDTHGDNLSMQRLLLRNNYKKCGIIYLNNGEKDNRRLAFEKMI